MTTSTTQGRLLGSGFAPLPRVNLLPPEIAERRRFRQVQYGLGGVILFAVTVVVLLYVLALHKVSSAHSDLNAATATNARLTGQVAQYQDVTALYDQAAAAQAMLATAMGDEVRYSHLLSDLSLSLPDNVWLTQVNFTQGVSATTAGAPVADGGIGSLSVGAVGFNHDDVAAWLDSLATQPNYSNPDFASSTETLLGTRKTVTFSSTAAITPAALSHRYSATSGG